MRDKTGTDPRNMRAAVLHALSACDNNASRFQAELNTRGLVLCEGDKPGRVILRDATGATQELGRAIRAGSKQVGLPNQDPSLVALLRDELRPYALGTAAGKAVAETLPPLASRGDEREDHVPLADLLVPRPNRVSCIKKSAAARDGFKAKLFAQRYNLDVEELPDDIGSLIGYIGNGSCAIKTRSGHRVFDFGDRVEAGSLSPEVVRLMAEIAEAKGWECVEISGSEEFKAAMRSALEERGIIVIDPTKPVHHGIRFESARPRR